MPQKSRGRLDAGQLISINRGWMERGIIVGSRPPLLALHKASYKARSSWNWSISAEGGGGKCKCIPFLYLRGRSDQVVRHDVLGDVPDGAKGVLHQVGRQVNPALDHGRDLVDDSPPGLLDELLKIACTPM